jgi:hypothetical protein
MLAEVKTARRNPITLSISAHVTHYEDPPKFGPLWHFTQGVLQGRTRESQWVVLLNCYFRADSSEESWNLLRSWAQAHGIRWNWEHRRRNRKDEIWVTFSVPPQGEPRD